MPTYQQYRSYGHTRFTAWTLSCNPWLLMAGVPIGANVLFWGAIYVWELIK